MEQLSVSYQTLSEFIKAPFGNDDNLKRLKYEDRYQSFKKNNRIKIHATMILDKNYFVHIKVPSESTGGLSEYDVVVQFFTTDPAVEKELSLKNYCVQFFSNSPGFVYRYASLYYLKGYLIKSLAIKFPPGVLDKLPEKSNSAFELYYDSSIYYACRFLLDSQATMFGKMAFQYLKRKNVQEFIHDIMDTEESNIVRSVAQIENDIKKEISSDNKLSQNQENRLKKDKNFRNDLKEKREYERKLSTFKDKANQTVVKKASTSTSKTKSIITLSKKKARRATRKS